MTDGFLGRWARRKEAARRGQEVPPEPERPKQLPPAEPSAAGGQGSEAALPASLPREEAEARQEALAAQPPPPTLEEARSLTPDADFSRFARPDVAPEVKNAAFRKLFTDPHFNVMDGLDVYIDDYSKPDPIPPEMLRNLASAKFLRMFDEKEEDATPEAAPADELAPPREVADDPTPQNVAQSGSRTGPALPPADDHADPDLRLQQDDAPGPPGPGAGAR